MQRKYFFILASVVAIVLLGGVFILFTGNPQKEIFTPTPTLDSNAPFASFSAQADDPMGNILELRERIDEVWLEINEIAEELPNVSTDSTTYYGYVGIIQTQEFTLELWIEQHNLWLDVLVQENFVTHDIETPIDVQVDQWLQETHGVGYISYSSVLTE